MAAVNCCSDGCATLACATLACVALAAGDGEAAGDAAGEAAGAGNAERLGHQASFFFAGARLGFFTLSWSGGRLA